MFTDRGGAYRSGKGTENQAVSERGLPQTTTASARANLPGSASQAGFPPSNVAAPASGFEKGAGSSDLKGPSVWVKKWVDYSSKYGLGYLLSNTATGVFFNDSTKIVIDPKGHQFYYYERKPVSNTEKQDVMSTHNLNDYPKDLQKKVTLLQHFRSYLENNNQNGAAGSENFRISDNVAKLNFQTAPVGDSCVASSTVYVKKWMRTKHAIMFRLSNKIV